MKYIYAPSYPSLRLICYFIGLGEKVTIISANLHIIELCKFMGWQFIVFDSHIKTQPRVRDVWNPFKILQFKRSLQALFDNISRQCKKGTFYYTIHGIDVLGMDIISRFATQRKDLNITYWNESNSKKLGSAYPHPHNFRALIYLCYYNLLYKPSYVYEDSDEGFYVVAKRNFISKHNIKILEIPEIFKMNVYQNFVDKFISSEICILGDYSLDFAGQSYEAEDLKDIYSYIKFLYPGVAYKPHPGYEVTEKFFDDYKKLPSFIPSEFLVGNLKVVISAATTGMNYLAINNVKCICILDLIGARKGFNKEYWKEKMLIASEQRILFPQTKDELKQCLLEFI
jgi:hypothetical protein